MTPLWMVVALFFAAGWYSERRSRIQGERLLESACETIREAAQALEAK